MISLPISDFSFQVSQIDSRIILDLGFYDPSKPDLRVFGGMPYYIDSEKNVFTRQEWPSNTASVFIDYWNKGSLAHHDLSPYQS